jgi:hypothetical protein
LTASFLLEMGVSFLSKPIFGRFTWTILFLSTLDLGSTILAPTSCCLVSSLPGLTSDLASLVSGLAWLGSGSTLGTGLLLPLLLVLPPSAFDLPPPSSESWADLLLSDTSLPLYTCVKITENGGREYDELWLHVFILPRYLCYAQAFAVLTYNHSALLLFEKQRPNYCAAFTHLQRKQELTLKSSL